MMFTDASPALPTGRGYALDAVVDAVSDEDRQRVEERAPTGGTDRARLQ
jgi:hypothetical protein